jgi:hypothetical protein
MAAAVLPVLSPNNVVPKEKRDIVFERHRSREVGEKVPGRIPDISGDS